MKVKVIKAVWGTHWNRNDGKL